MRPFGEMEMKQFSTKSRTVPKTPNTEFPKDLVNPKCETKFFHASKLMFPTKHSFRYYCLDACRIRIIML